MGIWRARGFSTAEHTTWLLLQPYTCWECSSAHCSILYIWGCKKSLQSQERYETINPFTSIWLGNSLSYSHYVAHLKSMTAKFAAAASTLYLLRVQHCTLQHCLIWVGCKKSMQFLASYGIRFKGDGGVKNYWFEIILLMTCPLYWNVCVYYWSQNDYLLTKRGFYKEMVCSKKNLFLIH